MYFFLRLQWKNLFMNAWILYRDKFHFKIRFRQFTQNRIQKANEKKNISFCHVCVCVPESCLVVILFMLPFTSKLFKQLCESYNNWIETHWKAKEKPRLLLPYHWHCIWETPKGCDSVLFVLFFCFPPYILSLAHTKTHTQIMLLVRNKCLLDNNSILTIKLNWTQFIVPVFIVHTHTHQLQLPLNFLESMVTKRFASFGICAS